MDRYKIYCETENIWKYVLSATPIAQCPDDVNHTVKADSVSVDVVNYKAIPDVTPRQIRQALILSGVSMQQITDSLNTLPSPQKELAIAEWEYSTAFIRTNPLVSSVGTMLGWTSQQLDNLWLYAGTL